MSLEPKTTKCVAVVQCAVSLERCSGAHCAISFSRREHHFAPYGDEARFYVPFSCGGCPGRRVSRLASQLTRMMKRAGVEKDQIVIHLSACVVNDNAHYPPCPHVEYMERILARKGMRVVRGSYVSRRAEERRRAGGYDR